MKMWALKGRNHGLYGLFISKHSAERARYEVWNVSNGYVIPVDVKKVNETFYEIRDYKIVTKKNERTK